MTARPPDLTDDLIERTLVARARSSVDGAQLEVLSRAIQATPQARSWPRLGRPRVASSHRMMFAVVSAAAAITLIAFAVVGSSPQRDDRVVVLGPSASAQVSPTPATSGQPSAEPSAATGAAVPCVVALQGSQMPPATDTPATVPDLGSGHGAYLMHDDPGYPGDQHDDLWLVDGSRPSTRVASFGWVPMQLLEQVYAELQGSLDGSTQLVLVNGSMFNGRTCSDAFAVTGRGAAVVHWDHSDLASARLSPDGRLVAGLETSGPCPVLVVDDIDGQQQSRSSVADACGVPPPCAPMSSPGPIWSQDSRSVAVLCTDGVFIEDAASGSGRHLRTPIAASIPSVVWLSDGRHLRLAWHHVGAVVISDLDVTTGQTREVSRTQGHAFALDDHGWPVLSPDGRYAVAGEQVPVKVRGSTESQLYQQVSLIDAETGRVQTSGLSDSYPMWTLDGGAIVAGSLSDGIELIRPDSSDLATTWVPGAPDGVWTAGKP